MSEKYTEYSEQLLKAMKKNDIDTLIKITISEPLRERLKINEKYLMVHGKEIFDDLKAFLKDDFKDLMVALYTNKIEYDAQQIYKALEKGEEEDDSLIELIVTRQGWRIEKIKKEYKNLYNMNLEKHIKEKTSGDFQNLLISLIKVKRNEKDNVDIENCIDMCKALKNIKEGNSQNKQDFYQYIASCSPLELMTISRKYQDINNESIEQFIESAFSGKIQNLIKAILLANLVPSQYFAHRIKDAVNNVGNKKNIFNRVIVTRNEIDIDIIGEYYKLKFEEDMIEDINDSVDGDYQKLLCALIKKNRF